jgi:AmmeMemoRadiSam system protein A
MSVTRLTPEQRSELLLRARRAGAIAVGAPPPVSAPPEPSGRLVEPGMSFVTWKRDRQLRGCIGSVEPIRPLWADVETNAAHALVRDPRFPPAAPPELPHLLADISVLSPFVPVVEPLDSVEVGLHGLLVERGPYRGLLLPQVPVEWGWDVFAFLSHACRKAGLPADAWRDPRTTISTFEAEVFGEDT